MYKVTARPSRPAKSKHWGLNLDGMLHHRCSQSLRHVMTLNPLDSNSVCLESEPVSGAQWWCSICPSMCFLSFIHTFIYSSISKYVPSLHSGRYPARSLEYRQGWDTLYPRGTYPLYTQRTQKPRLSKLEQLNKGNQLTRYKQGFIQDLLPLPFLPPCRIHTTKFSQAHSDRMDEGDPS